MRRRVVISGIGPVSALGLGVAATREALRAGRSGLARITSFDPSGFPATLGAEVPGLKISDFVPKSYRKATKIMARDIQLAVAAADLAARDAGLVTQATAGDGVSVSYPPGRVAAHIGSGMIAADLDELTDAFTHAVDDTGRFDMHRWGREGMNQLTPLWLLKYLPNMLACHVTIAHDAQGPSNTITCGEASGLLSLGESLRVIERGDADVGFAGGCESKLNPMGLLRMIYSGRLTPSTDPATAVLPFDPAATGTVVGEGGAILIVEAMDTCVQRGGRPRAEVVGYGASQTIHRESGNLLPDPAGRGFMLAIRAALRDAGLAPTDVDVIVPFGIGHRASDEAEMAAYRQVFGPSLPRMVLTKPRVGDCVAGASALDAALAVMLMGDPSWLAGPDDRAIGHALVVTTSLGGQNAAMIFRRVEERS